MKSLVGVLFGLFVAGCVSSSPEGTALSDGSISYTVTCEEDWSSCYGAARKICGNNDFEELDRGRAEIDGSGFAVVWTRQGSYQILGATIVGTLLQSNGNAVEVALPVQFPSFDKMGPVFNKSRRDNLFIAVSDIKVPPVE